MRPPRGQRACVESLFHFLLSTSPLLRGAWGLRALCPCCQIHPGLELALSGPVSASPAASAGVMSLPLEERPALAPGKALGLH